MIRRKYQVTRNRVQLHNRLESLLEEAHIKVSSLVSDLLGTSARRMLQALATGETDPATLASLADTRLRATAAQLADALRGVHDPLSGLPTKVMAVKVTTTPTFTHGPPVSLFDAVADNYAVTRDGRRFCSQFQLERSTYLRR